MNSFHDSISPGAFFVELCILSKNQGRSKILAMNGGQTESIRGSTVVIVLGAIFGGLTLVFFMALVGASLIGYEVPCASRNLAAAVLAIGTALSGAFLGGEAAVKGKVPLPFANAHPLAVSVTGGGALFIAVFLISSQVLAAKCDSPDLLACTEDYNHGAQQFNAKYYRDAFKYFTLVTQECPDYPEGWRMLGNTNWRLGDYPKAHAAFEKALALEPKSEAHRYNIGATYLQLKNFDEGEKIFRELAAESPGDMRIRYNLGFALQSLERFQEMKRQYDVVIEAGQESAHEAALQYAIYYSKDLTDCNAKQLSDVIAWLKKSVQIVEERDGLIAAREYRAKIYNDPDLSHVIECSEVRKFFDQSG